MDVVMRTVLLTTLLAFYGTYGQRQEFCSLPPDQGNCRGFFLRFNFDPSTNNCIGFIYGGCNGNQNNFETAVECLEACEVNDISTSGSSQSTTVAIETTAPDINNNGSGDTSMTESQATPSTIGAPASANAAVSEGSEQATNDSIASESVVVSNETDSDNENTFNVTGNTPPEEGNSTNNAENTLALEKDENNADVENQTDISKNNTNVGSMATENGKVSTDQGSEITSELNGTTETQITSNSSASNNETTNIEIDSSTKNATIDNDVEEEQKSEPSSSKDESSDNDTTTPSSSTLPTDNDVIPQPFLGLAIKPEVADQDCTSDPDRGYCRGLFLHYFFNTTTALCEIFFYGGCEGNGNNYDSIRSCQAACVEQAAAENEAVSEKETTAENEAVAEKETAAENEAVAEKETATENEAVSEKETGAENEAVSEKETAAENEAAVRNTESFLLPTIITTSLDTEESEDSGLALSSNDSESSSTLTE